MILPATWHAQNKANRLRWFMGNAEAIRFLDGFFFCVELWDDLIDKDAPITDEQINNAFTFLMLELPVNEWFVTHRYQYAPLIGMAINAFHDANAMAKSGQSHIRNLAFHIRNLGIEIHIATAKLTGGTAHMRAVSQEIREFFAFETFEEWEREHA